MIKYFIKTIDRTVLTELTFFTETAFTAPDLKNGISASGSRTKGKKVKTKVKFIAYFLTICVSFFLLHGNGVVVKKVCHYDLNRPTPLFFHD
jgi:hypothetical protein